MATFQAEEPDRKWLKLLPPELLSNGEFLLEWAHKLQWGDLSDSTVMDVGCGKTSLELFQAVFPKFHKVIAIDKSSAIINYLNLWNFGDECMEYTGNGKMEYYVADITNRATLTPWEAKMTKITSFYCFNCLTDPRAGFANIHYMLRPGGEAIILTGLKNPHFICAYYLLEKPEWKMYQNLLENYPEFRAHSAGLSVYENILSELDFEIISCVEDLRVQTFENEEKFRASTLTKDRTIIHLLPLCMQIDFREQYANALMELNGKSPEGQLYLRTSTARIVIRRKSDVKKP